MFPKNAGYEYSNTRMCLAKVDEEGCLSFVCGTTGLKSRDTYLECEQLDAGDYFLFTEVDWIANTKEKNCNITCYGPTCLMFEDVTESRDKGEFIKEILIKMACDAQGEEAPEMENIETEVVESNENIKRVTVGTKFGYSGYVIINDAEDSCYKENAEFKTFTGLTFLAPEEGSAFNISVECQTKYCVASKQSVKGYQMSKSYSCQVLMGEGSLVQKCKDEGKKTPRADGIYQMSLKHEGGIMYIYVNETEDQTLTEELGLEMKGLKVEG